ncbi:formate dehydrogenase accessory protein FdhE [Pseudomonas duriflava]|nr:formate dehydrogenase accessory protein FdhE [Pseudomonas duriflava]
MDPPPVVLPKKQIFAIRAKRLKDLAEKVEPLGDFLAFMSQLVKAQDIVLNEYEATWLPDPGAFDLALEHGMPALGINALRRDIDWQAELAWLLDTLELHISDQQRTLVQSLRGLDHDTLEALANDVLDGKPGPVDKRALLPFVSAALQVAWARLTQCLPSTPKRPSGKARTICPCCGSAPVASIIHADRDRSGIRYLHCGLCSTEWHLERSKCSVCEQSRQVKYLSLEDENGKSAVSVQAETCGDCNSYLKIVSKEFNLGAEPMADDLASLTLDMALAKEGVFDRSGFNPLLIVGE